MKYRKASDIFPDELLREIQKYSSGELIYIPKATDRENWGKAPVPRPSMYSEITKYGINTAMKEKALKNWPWNTACRRKQFGKSYINNLGRFNLTGR